MTAEWTYLVADLMTNQPLGEIPLSSPRISKALGASGSISGTMPLSTKIKADAYDLTTPCRRVLYALRDGTPWAGGIIWTRKYTRSSASVEIGVGDWWTYFDHRKVLPVLSANPDVYEVAGALTDFPFSDQQAIAAALVTQAQAATGGNIGVQVIGDPDSWTFRDLTYPGYSLVGVGEALTQLSKLLGGPDVMFDVGGLDSQGRPSRLLRLGNPLLGQQGSPHVFELDANVIDIDWPSDGSEMLTRAYATGDGQEYLQLISVSNQPDRLANGWPLLEGVDTSNTAETDPAYLKGYSDALLKLRNLPVVLPTLTVRGDQDPRIGSYNCGDDARVIVPTGDLFFRNGIDTTMRIVGIDISPGDVEVATLTMSPMLEDVA